MQAVGMIAQGSQANAAAKSQAELNRRAAERERQLGQLRAKQIRDDASQLAGTQRSILDGQGRDRSSGSALLVQADLAEEGEYNARLAENDSEATISSIRAQSVLRLAEGRNAQTAGYWNAGTTLLKNSSELKFG